jgi:acylphosphatase
VRAVDVVVNGLVQGVFYRATLRDRARDLGVSGWVSNQRDGSVAAHLEGSPESVDALVAWCHDGPSGAEVDHVEISEVTATGVEGFVVRRA